MERLRAGLHVRRAYGRLGRLCVLGILSVGRHAIAQAQSDSLPLTQSPDLGGMRSDDEMRLTTSRNDIAKNAQNPKAGIYSLSLPGYLISIPPQCEGPRRCPLWIQFPGAGLTDSLMMRWMHPVGDKYGLIVLTVTGGSELDEILKEIFQTYAIDPDKIAIIGRCGSGGSAIRFGVLNFHLFNRIGAVSGDLWTRYGVDPRNTTAQFYLDGGVMEPHAIRLNFELAQSLRREGHPTKVVLTFRAHEHQAEDYDFLGHSLEESWAIPDPAARPAPHVAADPLPLLTAKAVAQMTAFWTAFSKEPDSIRKTARRAHLHEVLVPVGEERPTTWMVDMPALAAESPAVAADLKKAGLTARQHDAYRVALMSAKATAIAEGIVRTDPTSVQWKNVEFLYAHEDEIETLEMAGVDYPDRHGSGETTPEEAESMGLKGMWYAP